jgi:nicotinamidase-related amidase
MSNFTVQNSAMVLVDHQVGTIDWAGALSPAQRQNVKLWARVLARFAKAAGMPVVLTSSMEDQAQGPLLPDFQSILPDEYAARIRRAGVINAWDDPAFANAVRGTGRKHLIMAGLTTEVCLVPPALAAKAEGFEVIALFDASGANTKLGEDYATRALSAAGIPIMTTLPLVTGMLGSWANAAAGAFFAAMEAEQAFALLAQGDVR